MHLEIKQANDRTEQVSSTCIDKLYNLSKNGLLDATSDLKGSINATSAYEDAVTFLNTMWGPNLIVTASAYYIRFADPEVVRVLIANGVMQEGEGLTTGQASTISFTNSWFKDNQDIDTFDEIKYFTGLLRQGTGSYTRSERTFQNSSLTSVDITNIERVSYYEFADCTNLVKFHGINGPSGVLNLEYLQGYPSDAFGRATASNAFMNCVGIESITSLGVLQELKQGMFSGCANLVDCCLPTTCVALRANAFKNDSKLQTINLSTLNIIETSVFEGCSSLEYCDGPNSTQGELNLPNLTGALGNSAFKGCTKLTSAASLGSITSIGKFAFENCTNLATINFPSAITSVGEGAFTNTAWFNNQPNGPVIISNHALYAYKGNIVGSYSVPNGVTSIGDYALYGQTSLTSVSIPESVTSIGVRSFAGCSGLTSITINAVTPPTLANQNAFDNTNNCPIYVLSGSVSTYQSASGWSTYASRIQAIPIT